MIFVCLFVCLLVCLFLMGTTVTPVPGILASANGYLFKVRDMIVTCI